MLESLSSTLAWESCVGITDAAGSGSMVWDGCEVEKNAARTRGGVELTNDGFCYRRGQGGRHVRRARVGRMVWRHGIWSRGLAEV